MLISELSKRAGVSIHTLRYYENFGFFQGVNNENVTSNNYKNYDEGLVETVALIKEAKEAGFTLAEIKHMLNSWNSKELTLDKKKTIINEKVKEVDAKMNQLKQVKNILSNILKDIEKGEC